MDSTFRRTTLYAVGTQAQIVDSVETSFTTQADLIAVCYSVIKNRFPFLGNAVKANRKGRAFAPTSVSAVSY
jgi:hypothetical protein